jgi:hypothetical protein
MPSKSYSLNKMIKIILTNILLFISLYIFFIAASFGFGFIFEAMTATSSNILYLLIPLLHLYINYRLAKKWLPSNRRYLLISCIVILGIWISYPYLLELLTA